MRKHVLWGHHISEYREMFDLTDKMLEAHVLEYGCGASAVNAELYQAHRGHMVSLDPLFGLTKHELEIDVLHAFETREQEVLTDPTQFNVTPYGGMAAFLASRREGMNCFFQDYDRGSKEGRYLPLLQDVVLPFKDFIFELALISHYLFADLKEQTVDKHVEILCELARVAKEVRVFPLIERSGKPSALLGPVMLGLQQRDMGVEVREVSCSLYPEGNAMLRLWAQACMVER